MAQQRLAQLEASQGVKKEKEEDCDEDEIEEMAPPPKQALVVIDLTEDDE